MPAPKPIVGFLSSTAACAVVALAWAQTPPQAPAPQGKSLAASAGLFAYPTKGQKPDQQARDFAAFQNAALEASMREEHL